MTVSKTKAGSPKKKSIIQKILKKEPDGAVVEELGKLLVSDPDLKVPLKEMLSTRARLKVELRRQFGAELEKFYARFLERCLTDRILKTEEERALHRLKILFGLSDATVSRIHNHVVQRLYSKTVGQVLSDKGLDKKQRAFLRSVEGHLKLPAELAERIRRDKVSELIQRTFMKALSDERLSPGEEQELLILAHNLGVQIEYDEKTRHLLDRYRLYWLLENGEIPIIETAIPLAKGEKCYFAADATWCELQAVTRRARYGSGLEELTEPDHIERKALQELTPLDQGRLYLTNKRAIFYGARRQRTIPLSRIRDFVPMENGVHIYRSTGASPFLQLELGAEVFSLLLARILRDLHA